MENIDISRIFDEIADVLELKDENVFRVRSYRRGARVVHDLPEDAKTLLAEGKPQEIPGIGKSLAEKIEEILKTGTCDSYEEIKQDPYYRLIPLIRIHGVGPKLAVRLHEGKSASTRSATWRPPPARASSAHWSEWARRWKRRS